MVCSFPLVPASRATTQFIDSHNAGEPWPELLGILFQLSQAPDASVRESAFRIFSTCPDVIEKQHEEMASGVFHKGFQDESVQVRGLHLYKNAR